MITMTELIIVSVGVCILSVFARNSNNNTLKDAKEVKSNIQQSVNIDAEQIKDINNILSGKN